MSKHAICLAIVLSLTGAPFAETVDSAPAIDAYLEPFLARGDLSGNLIVRITGNSGTSMSAMVVEQAVDINPVSQYVLDKFVDDPNLVLGDLALNEVVSLQDKVEAFDLTATADLSSMLAQLDAEVGELVDTEITVLNSTPDDGTAVAALSGTWNSIEFGISMHDSEQENFGTFGLDTLSEGFGIAAGAAAGEVDFTVGLSTFIDAWTNFGIDNTGSANSLVNIQTHA